MSERQNRKLERKNLVYFPEVVDVETSVTIGRIIDLTTEGFLLVCDNPMEEGKVTNATVNWVDEFGKEASFSCEIRVVWCKDDANPEYKAVGCKIDQINESNPGEHKTPHQKMGLSFLEVIFYKEASNTIRCTPIRMR